MASAKNHSTSTHNVRVQGIDAEDWKRFVELPYFRKKWLKLGLNDDDLRALQICLTASPRTGALVVGTGGLRKVRFARATENRGKSGSFRVGYVYFEPFGVIGLITVYAKSEQANVPGAQKAQLKDAIRKLEQWVAES